MTFVVFYLFIFYHSFYLLLSYNSNTRPWQQALNQKQTVPHAAVQNCIFSKIGLVSCICRLRINDDLSRFPNRNIKKINQ